MCENGYTGSLEDMVAEFNQKHINTLKDYEIGLDWFEGSAIGEAKEMHNKMSEEIFEKLYENGKILYSLRNLPEPDCHCMNCVIRCPDLMRMMPNLFIPWEEYLRNV
jgi:hypothetical protein